MQRLAMAGNKRIFKNKRELIAHAVQSSDTVLDIGFWGQGITHADPDWPHRLLQDTGATVYGLDMIIDRKRFPDTSRYQEGSAEDFSFPGVRFDLIFAGDLIEHLSNPGQFLRRCAQHLAPGGRLLLTTPNTFNLFNLAEKLSKDEPTVNPDHTMYFNHKVLRRMLEKNGFAAKEVAYVYSLNYSYRESWKKRILNVAYAVVCRFTSKFTETLVVIAEPA